MAPVALYPDTLLLVVLGAAAFPEQIADAAMLVRSNEDMSIIPEQRWEPAIKELAYCVGLTRDLYRRLDWSSRVGRAYLDAPDKVLEAIMRLRRIALDLGNLASGPEITVSVERTRDGARLVKISQTSNAGHALPPFTETAIYTGADSRAKARWQISECFPRPATPVPADTNRAKSALWGDAALIDQDLISQQLAASAAGSEIGATPDNEQKLSINSDWVRSSPELDEWRRAERSALERRKKLRFAANYMLLNGLETRERLEPFSSPADIVLSANTTGIDAARAERFAKRGRSSQQARSGR